MARSLLGSFPSCLLRWAVAGLLGVAPVAAAAASGNWFQAGPLPPGLRRVAVLPAAGLRAQPERTAMELQASVAAALTATGRVEVVVVTPEDLAKWTGRPDWESWSELPAELPGVVARSTGAQALLFTDVTSYRPYPPLALGLRLKLAETAAGRLLWAWDDLHVAETPPTRRPDPVLAAISPAGLSRRVLRDAFLSFPSRREAG